MPGEVVLCEGVPLSDKLSPMLRDNRLLPVSLLLAVFFDELVFADTLSSTPPALQEVDCPSLDNDKGGAGTLPSPCRLLGVRAPLLQYLWYYLKKLKINPNVYKNYIFAKICHKHYKIKL
ncbi:hypothetical protein PUN28_003652 [Cardiocondyla obscurior]|uniref:Uncharacterized protein n=1 Tax=Cardiocondyla obscurior TaxID=286306 RepID=A0AAW2GLN4_9HYME